MISAPMQRALELARYGPYTSPNPTVGAIVAPSGETVGEGVTSRPGRHAEVVALRPAQRQRRDDVRHAGALQPPRLHSALHRDHRRGHRAGALRGRRPDKNVTAEGT
jgi:tRNA(Arg) A34 adenosine deaminase TadA